MLYINLKTFGGFIVVNQASDKVWMENPKLKLEINAPPPSKKKKAFNGVILCP